MRLRPYQSKAVSAVLAQAAAAVLSTLLVLPTGTGKTVCFSEIARQRLETGRAMVVAHRTELINQAAAKLSAVTGVIPAIEKAELRSDEWNPYGKPPIVVASVQTLSASKGSRLRRFDPFEFSVLIIDEAHHGTADSYLTIINHFRQNPQCLILGVTATPDRGDKVNLGEVFASCAYEYSLLDAITDGYLVPIRQRTVEIANLDFSKVRTTAGDLNQGDLEAVMLLEEPLHGVAHATLEVISGLETGSLLPLKDHAERAAGFETLRDGRSLMRTLVFATSVSHAERLAEIFNRWAPDSADFIHGAMSPELRQRKLKSFSENRTQILVNVMIATEGFDAPFVECVVVARPTKSRPLFAQMCGRGTRPCDDVAHHLGDAETPEARCAMILASGKPHCLILDFAGNNGRHNLVTTVELIAPPNTPDELIDAAARIAADREIDVREALGLAKEELELKKRKAELKRLEKEKREEEKRRLAAEERKDLVGVSRYDIFDHGSEIAQPDRKGTRLAGLEAALIKFGLEEKAVARMSPGQKRELNEMLKLRRTGGLCTYKQGRTLQRCGYSKNELKPMSVEAASAAIDACKANGWRRPGMVA